MQQAIAVVLRAIEVCGEAKFATANNGLPKLNQGTIEMNL